VKLGDREMRVGQRSHVGIDGRLPSARRRSPEVSSLGESERANQGRRSSRVDRLDYTKGIRRD